jgi:hypothetical protein
MRLAMRPAPAAADAARASRCRPTRHPATAPWPAAACRARQAAPLRIARRRPCIAKSLHEDAACERACARAGECAASAHRAVVRARLRRGGSAGKGGGRENAAQTRRTARCRTTQGTVRVRGKRRFERRPHTLRQLRSRRDRSRRVMKVGLAWCRTRKRSREKSMCCAQQNAVRRLGECVRWAVPWADNAPAAR